MEYSYCVLSLLTYWMLILGINWNEKYIVYPATEDRCVLSTMEPLETVDYIMYVYIVYEQACDFSVFFSPEFRFF